MNLTSYEYILEKNGGVFCPGAATYAGPYAFYKANTDTVITSMTCAGLSGTLESITVKAGDVLPMPGGGTAVIVASGQGIFGNR